MQSITLPTLSWVQAETSTVVAPCTCTYRPAILNSSATKWFHSSHHTGDNPPLLVDIPIKKIKHCDFSPLSPSVGKLLVLVPSRMSRRLISLLLPGLITQIGAQNVDKEPDTVCVTYLSTYLVPISSNATGSVPADGADS
jgi:hypothetical protein